MFITYSSFSLPAAALTGAPSIASRIVGFLLVNITGGLLLTTIVLSMVLGRLLGLVWKHPRPIVEFPRIKELLVPLENWRSFPSDHTTISFIFAILAFFMGTSLGFIIFLLVGASLVAFSRIYVGVHYPRDIIGGIITAIIFSCLAFWLLGNVTQPIYNLFFR